MLSSSTDQVEGDTTCDVTSGSSDSLLLPGSADVVTSVSSASISESVVIVDDRALLSSDPSAIPTASSSTKEAPANDSTTDNETIAKEASAQMPITVAPSRSNTRRSPPTSDTLTIPNENFEAQTQLSDSTQSFEDVQQLLLNESTMMRINRTLDRSVSKLSEPIDKNYVIKVSTAANTSEQNSGHTSADEVETATSSDIEIISGPNGNGK